MNIISLLSSVWRSVLVIFITAVTLGLAHNSLSPLGVRSRTKALPSAQAARPTPLAASSPVLSLYSNQVLSLRVESMSGRTVPGNFTEQTPSPLAHNPSLPLLPSLTWPQVKTLLTSNLVVLVDTRSVSAFEAEHIPGAVSLPGSATQEQFSRFRELYPPSTPLVLYCASASCPIALRLGDVLIRDYSYTNVRHMPGGFAEFRLAQQLAAGVAPTAGK